MPSTLPPYALPGTLLGPATKYLPGPGTHIHESHIYSSIAGNVRSSTARAAPPPTNKPIPTTANSSSTAQPATPTPTSTNPTTSKSKPLPLLTVSRDENPTTTSQDTLGILGVGGGGGTPILPEVESTVLARVTRLGQRFASVEILVVSDSVCREPFQGMIRREDVRATEKDKVKIEESFRVGDLVRGVVISLGDQSNYYLSTAQNELGVVMAKSEVGNTMYPVSWKEFVDAKTGARERRKVAKPF